MLQTHDAGAYDINSSGNSYSKIAGADVVPGINALNYGELMRVQNDPYAQPIADQLWTEAGRNWAGDLATARRLAPIGWGGQPMYWGRGR